MNSLKLWTEIIVSPIKGFTKVDSKTKIALPVVIILLLVAATSLMLLPVLSSKSYTDALLRVQITSMQEKGTELSAEQIETMSNQMTSGNVKTITLISSVVGGVIGYFVMLMVSVLLLKLMTLIAKEKTEFKLLFRIVVFIAVISVIQLLLKNVITIFTDYDRILARVQQTSELQYALTSPVSIAAVLSPGKPSAAVYYLIDAFTDIFNWLYYGYLFAGLRGAAGLTTRKALSITIISAIILIFVGLIFTILV